MKTFGWFFGSILGVALLGLIDWATGYELSFFVFYFGPVAVVSWYLGFEHAVVISLLSALTWFAADFFSGHDYSSEIYAVWNTTIRLVAFLGIGWAVSQKRRALLESESNAEELRRTLADLKVLEAFLPICAECKKIRNKEGMWQHLEVYIGEHSNTQFSHGYCPDCAKAAMAEIGRLTGK
ncbi:MAG: DUF4118 domain-containing protein [Bdellovibrionales bacterium]|nr:DUF4118 domain-containing protein [Bdellovibrionales bacterium]